MEHTMKPANVDDLYLFAQVIEAGGFSVAERVLCMPKATISRRIGKLETQLGVKLIQRNTHQFEITHVGELYYRHCAAIVAEAESAQQLIEQHSGHPRGMVRLSCPKELLDLYVGSMLVGFMQLYPEVVLDVESTNRCVDVVRERFDFALRVRPWPLPDSQLVVRPFCRSRLMLLASPALVPVPLPGLAQLADYPSLNGHQEQACWQLYHPCHGTHSVKHKPSLHTESISLLKQAVCAGVGIAAMPYVCVMEELKSGLLQPVLPPEWHMDSGMIHAAYAGRRGMLPAVALLLDFLAENFEKSSIE